MPPDLDVMPSLPGTLLAPGRVVPGAELVEAATGRSFNPWTFRQRASLILAFVHPSCEDCDAFVRRLETDAGDDIEVAGGRVVAVRADAGGAGRFVDVSEAPVVVVLDRYAAAWSSYPAKGHEFPSAAEVAASLWHLATMCPECGVSSWD